VSSEDNNKALARRFLEASPTETWARSMNYSPQSSSIIACFQAKTLAGRATYRVPPSSTPASPTSATSSSIRQLTTTW
jgi:hypothetical protein